MTAKTHHGVVGEQFGTRAAAYVGSAVHASGEDLQQLAAWAKARGGPHARALDLGCGGGHASYAVAPHVGEIVAYDLSGEMLEAVAAAARERGIDNLATVRGAVEKLPFDDDAFDLVLTRYSAHHWSDFHASLREAHRVLRHGGHATFADVAAPASALFDTWLQALELLRDPSHVRDYSAREWRGAVADAGFTPEALTERKLHLDFASWVERMQTPDERVRAIRSLQQCASSDVAAYFAIAADGSFETDTIVLLATR